MDKLQLQAISKQLAHPDGEMGADISNKMNDTNAFITARAIEALAPKTGEFIVELGPGNGELSCELVQTIGQEGCYLGIEISSDMAKAAESTLRAAGVAKIEVHNGTCHDASVMESSIDGLMAVNVLYFVDDLDGLLKRIRPWFRQGGRCVFAIRPERTLNHIGLQDHGFRIRSPEEIVSAMQPYGFGDISITEFDEGEGQLGELAFPNGSIIIKAIAGA